MMTIKQVLGSGDQLFEALEVTYLNGYEGAAAQVPQQVMYLRPADKSWHSITEGMVYVMNDHGKTVSSYDLNEIKQGAQGMAIIGRAA